MNVEPIVVGLFIREVVESSAVLFTIYSGFRSSSRCGTGWKEPVTMLSGVGLAILSGLATFCLWQILRSQLQHFLVPLLLSFSALSILFFLLVTNWSFHHLYWTGWISWMRRHATSGLFLVGFLVVYRESFELSLAMSLIYWQFGLTPVCHGALVGAGTAALLLACSFALGKIFPLRKLMVWTGLLMGAVTLLFVGMTAQMLQQLEFLSSSPLVPRAWSEHPLFSIVGFSATWEGAGLQALTLLVLIGNAWPLLKRSAAPLLHRFLSAPPRDTPPVAHPQLPADSPVHPGVKDGKTFFQI